MKSLILLTITIVILNAVAYSQITFEKSYSNYGEVTVHNLESIGYKYMAADIGNNKVYLFNSDHTIWKTIDCKIPTGHEMGYANYPSTLLFDSDNGVEVLVAYQDTSTYDTYIHIVDENGTILQTITNLYWSSVVKFDNVWKLIASGYSSNNIYYSDVYSLPGKLLSVKKPGKGENSESIAYPNPMQNHATITYNLPKGVNNGSIQLFNSNGILITTFPVNKNSGSVHIERADLPSGVYHYSVTSGNEKYQTHKLIIR